MRRAHLIGLALVGGSLAVAAACGFPSPDLLDLPSDAAASPEASPTVVPDGTTPGADGALLDGPLPEAAPFDGSVAALDAQQLDGDANVTLADGAVVNCDEDNDRFPAVGGRCGGFDCNDTNATVRPNQIFNASAPIPGDGGPGTLGDWNCNGTVEREFETNVSRSCPSLAGLGCAKEGWEGVPACGSVAVFVRCTPTFLGCNSSTEMRTVSCK